MSVLGELGAAVGAIARDVGPSVVGVGHGWGSGSGVVIAPGQILTNAHNVRGGEVTVVLAGGRSVPGEVAGVDVDRDLAVVAASTGDTPAIAWSDDADAPAVGAAVVALAGAHGRARASLGFVSARERSFRGPRGRRISGAVEHTAPLVRGSSGGPLVDAQGRLVGLNTHRMGDGFYLAQPADADLRARVEALARGEAPRTRRLGVGLAPARMALQLRRAVGLPDRAGLLVRVVEEGSPADHAGLEPGDLIVAVGDGEVTSTDDLHHALDGLADGESLVLHVVRGNEERTVSVTFGSSKVEGSA